jgi:hypothetical protein
MIQIILERYPDYIIGGFYHYTLKKDDDVICVGRCSRIVKNTFNGVDTTYVQLYVFGFYETTLICREDVDVVLRNDIPKSVILDRTSYKMTVGSRDSGGEE